MTTTKEFQKNPDFYLSKSDCKNHKKNKTNTNPRYKNFTQTHFTAGDIEQFNYFSDISDKNLCIKNISIQKNIFNGFKLDSSLYWEKYKNLNGNSVDNTFSYIFNKFKKGIFIKIQNNELKVFLPFSNPNFINEWKHRYNSEEDMYVFLEKTQKGKWKFNKRFVNSNTEHWYGNNCLVRYEYPVSEGDSGAVQMSDMFKRLCENRKIPDMEFFVNRRDFPIITKDETEPYDNIFGDNQKLLSFNFKTYSPILSMVTTNKNADIPIPTWDDWARVSFQDEENPKYFPKDCKEFPDNLNKIKWQDKKPVGVFRGGSTGCGTTSKTNMRLKVADMMFLPENKPKKIDGYDDMYSLIDAYITNWNLRPRIQKNSEFLETIDIEQQRPLGNSLTYEEQSYYKYIINIDGHVAAYRLSIELSMGSVVLLQDSKYKIWYRDYLIPLSKDKKNFKEAMYIPIEENLSNLFETIEWCRENDKKCEIIANNSVKFYNKYLRKEGLLDFLQYTLINLKKENGIYINNQKYLINKEFSHEKEYLENVFKNIPKIKKDSKLNLLPEFQQSYNYRRGLEWIILHLIKKDNFQDLIKDKKLIFEKKSLKVICGNFQNVKLCLKENYDIQKNNEFLHSAFVGMSSINNLTKKIPNFAYTFYGNEKICIMENIEGYTFDKYLKGVFNFGEYIWILIQISLAMKVAENECGLVHNDLRPWNIIIKRLKNYSDFYYNLGDKKIKIKTKVIPVIIDYGKSTIIQNGKFRSILDYSPVSNDILSVLMTSFSIIFKNKNKNYDQLIVNLSKYFSGTNFTKHKLKYYPNQDKNKFIKETDENFFEFKNKFSLMYFLEKENKFNRFISSEKYELKNKNYTNFLQFLMNFAKNNYLGLPGKIENVNQVFYEFDKSNSKQILNFAFSKNNEEKINSYIEIFNSFMKCELPTPQNLFSGFYSLQFLSSSLNNLNIVFKKFINSINQEFKNYEKYYTQCIQKLETKYLPYLNYQEKKMNYNIPKGDYPLYSKKIFEDPIEIKKYIDEYSVNIFPDYSEAIEIINYTLNNTGKYKMDSKILKFYHDNFNSLLSNPAENLLKVAINNTILDYSQSIAENNIKLINSELEKNSKCKELEILKKNYELLLNN